MWIALCIIVTMAWPFQVTCYMSRGFCWSDDHDDVIKWKHFRRYWPFVRGIHRSTVKSPHKGQWRGALMFSLIRAWINAWVNNGEAGDLRRHRAHYDVTLVWRLYFHLDGGLTRKHSICRWYIIKFIETMQVGSEHNKLFRSFDGSRVIYISRKNRSSPLPQINLQNTFTRWTHILPP